MINHEYMFLETLEDIRTKLKGKEYDYIRACGLLRHLLLDQNSLMDIVNRNYKLHIYFRGSFNFHIPVIDGLQIFWKNISTGIPPVTDLRIQDFLKATVLIYKGEKYDVREIIRTAAHVMGGIHSQKIKPGREENLVELLTSNLELGGQSMTIQAIKGICEVSVNAMFPLERKILSI